MKRLLFLLLIAQTFYGCSTSFKLSPDVSNSSNQNIIYVDGNEVAVSMENDTTVGIYAEKSMKNELVLYVIYQNNSNQTINIDPAEITIEGISRFSRTYGKRYSVSVYSADEYIKKLQRDQAWQAFGETLTAISMASSINCCFMS